MQKLKILFIQINEIYLFMLVLAALSCVSFWGLFAMSKERYLSYNNQPISKDLVKIL